MTNAYLPRDSRYDGQVYRRVGKSGLKLPAISLGLWQNFGDNVSLEIKRAIVHRAFDLGVTHFDLANNYGPPYGSAEVNFGRILREDLHAQRDELIISTKAIYDMWTGLYGEWGSRKHIISSLDQSLKRLDIDYVDIFYSHRFDPSTPLEETMGALHHAVISGRALYAGISSYSAERTREAARILRDLGTPRLIHQPSYSMFNCWIEAELIDAVDELGVGILVLLPLAQGLLTSRYLNGIPVDSRGAKQGSMRSEFLSDAILSRVQALNQIVARRGQTLAQLALSWALRRPSVSSALIGASSVRQLEENLAAFKNVNFAAEDLGINPAKPETPRGPHD
jgi:L-glyceraldehyde 3-phosphate reductase